ncbi:MAG: sel1 repeat family protein [Rhodospirillaceae bacterium]|jgi:TPR repeat protein|nr:sel1 repeat family protein [Rhodospirillaceae bacterium]MBT5665232.1 sel1 repeat family protein [Rhodospirillaceae bacterium]MBT5809527.1 sel1 repeat family protein [Rhodospirillaceae bacterium]
MRQFVILILVAFAFPAWAANETPVLASSETPALAASKTKAPDLTKIQGIPDIEVFMFCDGLMEAGCALFKAKEYKQAFAWFNNWAERGEATSMNNMGVMLEAGLGVKVDFKRARTLYLLSSEADVAIAQYNLGMMLGAQYMDFRDKKTKASNAEIASRNEDLLNAYKWLRLAANQGHNKAMAGADELEPYMTANQIKMALHRVGWTLRQMHKNPKTGK